MRPEEPNQLTEGPSQPEAKDQGNMGKSLCSPAQFALTLVIHFTYNFTVSLRQSVRGEVS